MVTTIIAGTAILIAIVTAFIIADTRKTLNRVYDSTCDCRPFTVNLWILKIHGRITCKHHS